jgi:hypothetical protein
MQIKKGPKMTTRTAPTPRIRLLSLTLALSIAWLLSVATLAEDGSARIRPKTYGTSQDSIYHVSINDFEPRFANTAVEDSGVPDAVARYSPNCPGSCLEAIPRLPNGAVLTAIEAYFCNTDANVGDSLGIVLAKSLYDGTNPTSLVGVFSTSHNGCGEFEILDLTSLNYQVNVYDNQLILRADIDAIDGTQAIAGVNIFYRLQVSPSPPTADFGDVPTSHPFFQFVEALSASGITAGCGNGNFCPDAPLTRGQMAVFLSKALGLQWP